jgi:hypothetical protein
MNFANPPTVARGIFWFSALGLLAAAAVSLAPAAEAESLAAARNSRCNSRGADFVAVAGSENCVRLGGHVRVRLGRPVSAYSGPTPDGVQPASERTHVRTDPISSFIQLFPR